MITWTNETRKLRELIPWEHNPREINKREAERLGDSLAEFGQIQTIAVGPDNEIYDGHQRKAVWALLPQFGPDYEVDVRVSSRALTEQERQKLVVYLHRGTMGQWDWDALANTFEVPDLLEWGFEESELQLDWGQNEPQPWNPEYEGDGDGIMEVAGYSLASIWYDLPTENIVRSYMLELPTPPRKEGATVKWTYSRTNATETERIVKTYMRPGDLFFEMCCGWMTFSSTAKYFGFSGKGSDIWDVALEFCKRQIRKMPGEGKVEVCEADCRQTGESSASYDFVHSNPPFFSLEPYGNSDNDLANTGKYELWLDGMADMGAEAARILKPGGLANFVINDYRQEGVVVPMHADFIAAMQRDSGLVLHDLVIAEVVSQALRFRKHDYERRRTVKCHEYVITFRKPLSA